MTTKTEITFAQRITTAMQKIKRLEKSGENKFGKYNYTPVDDVKDLIRPALADAGLALSVTEDVFEIIELRNSKGEVTTCAKIRFIISLYADEPPGDFAVEGVRGTLSDTITIVLPYTGAQTSGAARSYAVKEWAKATLLVSTGEGDAGADADSHQQQEYRGEPAVRKAPENRMSPDLAEETAKRLVSQIKTCKTHDELDFETKQAGFKRDLNDLSAQWPDYAQRVIDEGKAHRQALVEASNQENFPVGE